MGSAVITITAEDYFFPIGAKHWKGIKSIAVGELRKASSIFIDHVKIKRKPSFIFMIGSKDDAFVVVKKCRRPVGLAK